MKFLNVRLATALLATTAVGIGAVEIEANRAARGTVRSFLDNHPGVSVASVLAEPFTGRLILRGVQIRNDADRIDIGRLVLPFPSVSRPTFGLVSSAAASPFDDTPDAPAPAEEAPKPKAPAAPPAAAPAPAPAAAPGAAAAENLTITSGQTIVRIKRIDMTGTNLTGTDISALLDPKSAEPAEARFKKLTATAIVVPEILIDDTTPGTDRHAAINQVLLSGVVAGKIAAGSATGISLAIKKGDENNTGAITAIQATGLDLVQFARVFTTVRSDDAAPILPLYDTFVINGIKITDEKKKSVFSVGTLKETGLKGRPLATDFITNAKNRTEKLSDAAQAVAFNDMANSFEIGTLEANDLSVRGLDDEGATNFSLASVSMRDFAKAKIGGFALRALHFEGPKVKFGIGTIDVGPFGLPRPKSIAPAEQDPKDMVPSVTTVSFGTIDFDVVTPEKDGAPPSRIQFKLGHAGLANDGDPGEIPRSSKLTIDNLAFDVPPNAAQAQALVDMGYRHLDVSAALATAYDSGAQTLKLDNLMLNGANMGSIAIGIDLANVSKGIVSQDKEVAKASALAILVKGLKLDVVNTGLFERALAWKAKQDGKTPDEERAFAADFIGTQLPAIVDNHPNATLVGNAIAKFVNNPKNLHVSIVSKSGLGAASMGMLGEPKLLLDTLDVKASAND